MKREPDKKQHSAGGEPDGGKLYPDHSVVAYCLHESAVAAGYSTAKLVEAVEAGLPVEELETLRAGLDLPMEQLASRLGISKATLHRRKRTGRLEPEESGRVLRFARLTGKAVEVFESRENARRWLSSPQMGLGGAVPLDYAETEIGSREVEDLLGRIEYGVYS
jgi:putative toxin-antitoxin system antitoxin component (TIGR02293 family)